MRARGIDALVVVDRERGLADGLRARSWAGTRQLVERLRHRHAIAMRIIKAGFGGPGLFIGDDSLPHMYLTSEIKTRTILRIRELVAEARVRADVIIAENEAALITVATAVYRPTWRALAAGRGSRFDVGMHSG